MGWFKRLFGSGRILCEFVSEGGKVTKARMSYEGSFPSEPSEVEAMHKYLIDKFHVQFGWRPKSVRIVAVSPD